jgi:hypothetical protein
MSQDEPGTKDKCMGASQASMLLLPLSQADMN